MFMGAQIERDEYLRPFQAYSNRYRHSNEASFSQDPLYYSNDVGRAHTPFVLPLSWFNLLQSQLKAV